VVLHGGEELHHDVDLALDQDLHHLVLGFDHFLAEFAFVTEYLEFAEGHSHAGGEVLQEEDMFGLLGHVADLLVVHVVVADCFLDGDQLSQVAGHDFAEVGVVEVAQQGGTLEDLLELLEQADLLLDGVHTGETLVDVLLDVALLLGDVDSELDLALVEAAVVDLELVVAVDFKLLHLLLEFVDVLPVDVVVVEDVDLLLDQEHLNQLVQLAFEAVEQAEDACDFVVVEVERALVAVVHVGVVVLEGLLVLVVELDTL